MKNITKESIETVNNLVQSFKKGGIHIKKENVGKFTATKKKTGKSTEQLKHSKNPLTRKRAVFAANVKKWHHKDGGSIEFLMPLINQFKLGGIIEEFKKGGHLSKKYIEEARKKPGGSNVGKKTFASGKKRVGPYAGPSGGAPKGSYPIGDKAHGRAALKLAHNAPNPSGIKAAVYRKYPDLKKHQLGGKMNDLLKSFNMSGTVDNLNNYKSIDLNLGKDDSKFGGGLSIVKTNDIPYTKIDPNMYLYGNLGYSPTKNDTFSLSTPIGFKDSSIFSYTRKLSPKSNLSLDYTTGNKKDRSFGATYTLNLND